MAISIPNIFVDGTTALAAEVNANFAEVGTKALDKTGDTVSGTIALSGGGSIAGATGIITGTRLVSQGTGATSLQVAGGGTFGTGSVALIDVTGKLTVLDSTTLLSTAAVLSALTMTGTINCADNLLTRPEIKDYSESKTAPTISGGTLTLDLEQGNVFVVDLNANITTLTVSNWPASGKKGSLEVWFVADGTPRTVTLGAIRTIGGSAYTPTSTAGKYDVVTLHSWDAGTNVSLLVGGQNL